MKRAIIAAAIAVAFLLAFVLTPPRGPRSMRSFDPDRLADLEVGMWQAYYAKARVHLSALLVTLLHERYRYSWADAAREGFHLARAAATFGNLRGGYDQVLPDLEAAYQRVVDGEGKIHADIMGVSASDSNSQAVATVGIRHRF